MQERDLILGVLATQAGFVTPAQVMEAAAARLIGSAGQSLLGYLERNGALSPARRALLEAMAAEAISAREGNEAEVLRTLGGEAVVSRTFGLDSQGQPVRREGERLIPAEREGQYTRLDELGRGSQSVVHRAVDEFIGREVALKELWSSPASESPDKSPNTARVRFLREARLTAQLDHPGIVAVHELARRADGTLFSSQKLIRGRTLKARLARCESLAERLELLPHLIDACQALAYAHSRGVIHRDVKPSNIMVGEYGETVLLDWGLAKKQGEEESTVTGHPPLTDPLLTVAGQALGTPAYMSPEQARGLVGAIDERSDVFGLGAILYEILTGRVPFEGATAEQALNNVLAGRLTPIQSSCPEAPPELIAVAGRALQRDPAARYQKAEDLAGELLAFRSGRRVEAYEYRSWELITKFIRRNRALSAVSAAALLVLVVSAAVIAYQLRVARLKLADSFLERAQLAEQASDWGRAAGYYAASRVERDSREGRWGVALARERMPRRVLALTGADGAFVDVAHDGSGQPIVLSMEAPWVIARDLSDGRERWRYRSPDRLNDANFAVGRFVEVWSAQYLTYLDGTTGEVLDTFDRDVGAPCRWGPPTRRAQVSRGVLTVTVSGGPDRSWSGGVRPVCAVSPDGRQLAFRDLEGVVHLWDLEESKEVTSRLLRDASQLLFTAHGIAAVRGRSVQMFGGKEGDFSVTLPGRESSPATPVAISANMVSPDGHRLVIARLTASQADVVDLRTRSVVASVSFAAGTPQFAFSPSGDRLLVAGLRNGSALQGWEIPSPPPVRTYLGAPLQVFRASRDARRLLVFLVDPVDPRFELRDENGAILLAGKVGSPGLAVALSDDGQRLAVSDERGAVVLDAASGRSLGHVDCEGCHRLALSADGSRLLMASEKKIELWDVGSGRTLWEETERLGRLDGPLSLSGNGQAVLWGEDRTLRVHREGQASGGELKLDQRIQSAAFSHDDKRLVAVTSGTIGVWGVGKLESRWQVRNPSWAPQWVQWSGDDSAVMVSYDGQGVVLRDSGTGRRFATIGVSRPDALATQEMVLPDLRHRLSRGNAVWEIRLLPPPDDLPPRESLARALAEAGLQMQGVELVDAPPGPRAALEAERR